MVNGLSYPLTIDAIEHLYLESNYSQPVAVLLSVCDEVPDDLLLAYYTPADLLTAATTALLVYTVGLMIHDFTMWVLKRTKLTDFFADVIKDEGQEAAGKDGGATGETLAEQEARVAFFWILQLVLGISFALDYFWTKSPYGTEKTGWQACKCAHFTMLFLYKPLVAPMYICLLNLSHLSISDIQMYKDPAYDKVFVRPKLLISLAVITGMLFSVWFISTLPFLPLAVANLINFAIALIVIIAMCLIMYSYIAFMYNNPLGEINNERALDTFLLSTRIMIATAFVVHGYLPVMSLILYSDASVWGRLQTVVWSSCGKLVADSFDFSFLTWPDLNLDIDFKLSLALMVLAAERLQAVWAGFYNDTRKRRVQPSVPAAPGAGAA